MQLTCPCCGVGFPLEAGLNDADARRFALLMGELPPAIARLLPAYLARFKPPKQGLRWSRLLALAEEIAHDIRAGQVERHGRAFAAPVALWVQALDTVIAKTDLTLPLKGHGLLREIVAAGAGKVEARAEAAIEKSRASPAGRAASGPAPIGPVLDTAHRLLRSVKGRQQAAILREALRDDDAT